MKKKKKIGLILNKRKVSELNQSIQQQLVGAGGTWTVYGCQHTQVCGSATNCTGTQSVLTCGSEVCSVGAGC